MIRKQNFKLNWKYALGELTLIFLGISLAIWFNNWNDSRKRKDLEKDILIQVYSDIQTNLNDVRGDFDQLLLGLQGQINIESYINEDRPYVDSMCFDFHWLKKDEYVFPVKGAYDKLKSIGLDIITNDSIRAFVQSIFEFGYPRISRATPFHPDLDEFFSDYYRQHFTINEDTTLRFSRPWEGGTLSFPYWTEKGGIRHMIHIGFVPLDFEALKRDTEFKVMLRQAMEYRQYKMRQYNNVMLMTKTVIPMIERELGVDEEDLP